MKPRDMSKVLIFTSCVTPGNMTYTAIVDPEFRRKEYVSSLQYYLSHTNYRIVVVDNSGYKYEELDGKFPDRLEILYFHGNDYKSELGKGYGEGLILKYAFDHSVFLRDYEGPVAKVSGRHQVMNINALTNVHSLCSIFSKKVFFAIVLECDKWIVSDFFIAPKSFYRALCESLQDVNDSKGYYFEHCLYDVVRHEREKGNVKPVHSPFPLEQNGFSGSTGRKLSKHGSTLKFMLKSILYSLGLDVIIDWYNEKIR